MSNYFVLDFKKIKNKEAYKNVIVGHNFRKRNYKNKDNIDTKRTNKNIILTPLKFESEDKLLEHTRANLKEGKRQIRANSAKSFSIVVDCSVIQGWQEKDYIKYLEKADKWLNNYFKNEYGLINLGSTIHMDESKPHLHISFSYFSEIDGAWIQKKLSQNKVTDFNTLLKKFETEVGSKFNLVRGNNKKELKKLITTEIKKLGEEVIVKKGFLKEQNRNVINTNEVVKMFTDLLEKVYTAPLQVERLRKELIKYKGEMKGIESKVKQELENKYIDKIKELTEALESDLKQELIEQINIQDEHIKELQNKLNNKNNEINNKNKRIQELQDKLNRLEKKKEIFKGIDI